ncbi:hypothetical protein PISMIDRAFT_108961 [Pisolithus microcarpus 441]|uniref:Uncharacterized protein n=1 Tax=Pisolithus microcarpus 441 TaxID=765257 RepID=A0A0C9YXQ5_9AGAM|nr:hypothetical protein PISMIDRAFT_108961 [Pisolithus microcarpus 441]
MQSYLKAAKLQGWLSQAQCPPAIQECKILLDRAYGVTEASQDLGNDPDGDSIVVPPTAVPHEGVVYSRSSTHVGNSLIMFYPQGCLSVSSIPGSIKYVFGSSGFLTFAVQQQLPLPSGMCNDPFASYLHFPAKLYSSAISDDLEIVQLSWVMSHFARLTVADDRAVVLSLCHISSMA